MDPVIGFKLLHSNTFIYAMVVMSLSGITLA